MRFGCTGVFLAMICAVSALSSPANAQSAASFPEPAPSPAPPAAAAPAPTYTPAPAAAPVPTYRPPPAAVPSDAASQLMPPYPPEPPSNLRSLPPLLPYRKGLPVPAGYRVVERSATGLTIGGGLTFLAAYAAGLGLAASQSFDNGTAYNAIPVLGPWAAIGGRSFSCKVSVTLTPQTGQDVQKALNKCVGAAIDDVTTVVFLTADGLVQATGAVLFFVGLASGYQELVREDLPKAAVNVLPEGGFSLSVAGHF